ncbi:two-component system response regulator [filamentous cyanobacterium CCP5]|nr:two-component system response regulator [filamentous cyanobacterium CCP5]
MAMPSSTLSQPSKPRMLVVDDEPDNLDLLYRTFRREFKVLRAESGQQALQLLEAEGEVAVIISDQRMPEMKGTEFLSKTLPEFPDTMRIILTGFTDVEDLVEAINAGQVYRYITKPWEPEELRSVVVRAAETYDLLKQRTEELTQVQMEATLMHAITAAAQTQESFEAILAAAATAFGAAFEADTCTLQPVESGSMGGSPVTAGSAAVSLSQLLADAVSHQAPQIQVAEAKLPPSITGITQPVIYRGQTVAVIGLGWSQPKPLTQMQQQVLALGSENLAIALQSLCC